MNSFKSLGRLLVVTALLTVLFTVGINIQTAKAFDILDENERVIDEVEGMLNENEFPIRVFANIAAQTVDSDEKFELLSKAYSRSKLEFERNLIEFVARSSQLEFDTYELMVINLKADEKQVLQSQLKQVVSEIEEVQGLLDTSFSVPIIRDADLVSKMEEDFVKIEKDLADFHKGYSAFSSDIRHYYLTIYNTLIGIAIVLIAIMGLVVFRIIGKDLHYITKTYEQLDSHNYDVTSLLPEKQFLRKKLKFTRPLRDFSTSREFLRTLRIWQAKPFIWMT